MAHFAPPSSELGLARAHFNSLPAEHQSRQFFEGAQYQSPKGVLSRVYHSLFVQPAMFEELTRFYPYQNVVAATKEEWERDSEKVLQNSAVITTLAIFTIFNLGRRNYVLPVLREYGRFLGTHRVFRQYVYSALLPFFLLKSKQYKDYYRHFEALNHVHANRLNQKILSDPENSWAPRHLGTF